MRWPYLFLDEKNVGVRDYRYHLQVLVLLGTGLVFSEFRASDVQMWPVETGVVVLNCFPASGRFFFIMCDPLIYYGTALVHNSYLLFLSTDGSSICKLALKKTVHKAIFMNFLLNVLVRALKYRHGK